jgi:acyl carrier protein
MKQIKGTVRRYFEERRLVGESALDDDTALEDLEDMEALGPEGLVELVDFLEDAFAIAIDDAEIVRVNLGSVNRIARFVRRKRGLRERPPGAARDLTPGIVLDDQSSG